MLLDLRSKPGRPKPLNTGADRGAVSGGQTQHQSRRTVQPGVSVGAHAEERLSETQDNTFQVDVRTTSSSAEQSTDLVSVRVGILGRTRRRGGGASFTLDVERKRERLEGRMGRERRETKTVKKGGDGCCSIIPKHTGGVGCLPSAS